MFANLIRRLLNFPKKTKQQRFRSYVYRWLRWFPKLPAPVLLPFGSWWLLDRDYLGRSLLGEGYENSEWDFELRFVKPGMTALDIGAHRGFHTLLLSKSVGKSGRVLSFEPSPADVRRLLFHVTVNLCRNVSVRPWAIGEENGVADLYVIEANTVQNSLRPQHTGLPGTATPVVVRKLDDVLSKEGIHNVDFVKLDVEGAELQVLKGAERLLTTVPRPVILCEVLEETAMAWGYHSRLIVEYLADRGFSWFALNDEGKLVRLDANQSEFHGNFVAVPEEAFQTIRHLCASTCCLEGGSEIPDGVE
ncbi:MAG: hypothetical protein JWO71_377 [Candidatus Acidoferrum typicum]|nr:hypothetical protein [Candidatus Acidoferrum typicum]